MPLFNNKQIRRRCFGWAARGFAGGLLVGLSVSFVLQYNELDEVKRLKVEAHRTFAAALAATHEARAAAYAEVIAHCLNGGMIATQFDTILCDRMEKKHFWSASK